MQKQPTKKLTLKEKLQRSLDIKKGNLLNKKLKVEEIYKAEIADINEKLEVVELQLNGLKK